MIIVDIIIIPMIWPNLVNNSSNSTSEQNFGKSPTNKELF